MNGNDLLFGLLLLAAVACSKVADPVPASPANGAPAPAGAPRSPVAIVAQTPQGLARLPAPGVATERSPSARPRRKAPAPATAACDHVVLVEGSPRDGIVYRGWPALVRVIARPGVEQKDVRVHGPSEVTLVAGPAVAVATAATTQAMALGVFTFVAGEGRTSVEVVDAPSTMTTAEVAVRHRLTAWCAMALGDTATVRTAAADWAAAEPRSEAPHAALGEALLRADDVNGALAAFSAALERVPAGQSPPPHLLQGQAAALARAASRAGTKAATASPSPSPASSPPAVVAEAAAAGPPGLVPQNEHDEARFLADPAGQWASSATAGSMYGPSYGPQQATGAPDVTAPGDSHAAWCHASAATTSEWIELTFATPVQATELRVRQNNAPGAIVKVEAVASDGAAHVLWAGKDPATAPQEACIQWFVLRLVRTEFLVARIKLTLDLTRPGWEEIDAVQLVGAR